MRHRKIILCETIRITWKSLYYFTDLRVIQNINDYYVIRSNIIIITMNSLITISIHGRKK